MQSIQSTIDLAFRLLEHTLFIPSNLPLLLQGQRKELPSSSFDPLALLQQNPVVDHLEETPVLACIAYFCNKPFKGFGVGIGVWRVYQREVDQGYAFDFGGGEFWPVLGVLDESWINLSHGC